MTVTRKRRANDLLRRATNQYGNVSVYSLPDGLVHIDERRASITMRAHKIPFAPALVGWRIYGRYIPILRGVVVCAEDEQRARAALELRDRKRPSVSAQMAARCRKQNRETRAFAQRIRERFPAMPLEDVKQCAHHATQINSGRVGRSTVCDDPVLMAVIAHIRHHHTGYDQCLGWGMNRAEARNSVASEIDAMLEQWAKAIDLLPHRPAA